MPTSLNIHGVLVDRDDRPVTGTRAWSVAFYDNATTGTLLGSKLSGMTWLNAHGEFNIYVNLPNAAMNVGSLWYELAIDSDQPADGDPSNNAFPKRVFVSTVPYAINAYNLIGRINATQIYDGSISNTEFLYLNGLTGNIQNQFNLKANTKDVYTQKEIDSQQAAQDTAIALKASLSDVYTKPKVDASQAAQDAHISSHALALQQYEARLTTHTQQLAVHTAELTTHGQLLAAHAAELTTHAMLLAAKANSADVYSRGEIDASQAAQDAILSSHSQLLSAKAVAANVYTKAEIDAWQAAQDTSMTLKADAVNVYTRSQTDASQGAQNALISSHTLAFRRDEPLLTTHTNQIADLQSLTTTHTRQMALKASTAAMNSALALKADADNVYTKAQIDDLQAAQNTSLTLKANTSAMTSALALKADAGSVYNKAQVDTALSAKANSTDVSSALALKANSSDMTSALALKANSADMAAALSAKADASSIYTQAQIDSQQSAQDMAIALKADAANVYTTTQSDSRYLRTEADTLAAVTGRGATTSQSLVIGGRLDARTTATINGPLGIGTTTPSAKLAVVNRIGSAVNIATGGTATASSQLMTYAAGEAFNGDLYNSAWYSKYPWDAGNNIDQWIKYDFGTPRVVTAYRITVIRLTPVWKFQGSNDDTTWVDLDSHTGFTSTFYQSFDYSIANRTAYRYYRFFVAQADFQAFNNCVGFSEIELYCNYSRDLLVAGTAAMPGGVGIGKANPASVLDVGGSLALPTQTVSANTVLDETHFLTVANAALTVGLPPAASCPGRTYAIRRETPAGAVTVAPSGSEMIDGIATKSIDTDRTGFVIQSDGAAWHTLAAVAPATDLSGYYTKSQTDNLLAAKANSADIATSLSAKANSTEVATALAAKANTSDMTTALAAKANTSDMTTALAAKLDAASAFTQAQADTRYLQSEADTLESVTGRGAATSRSLTLSGNAQTITHTGATGLAIASNNGYLRLGQGANANVLNLTSSQVNISTTATVAQSLTMSTGTLRAGSATFSANAGSGRVGIGTASPAARLDVQNAVGSAANIATSGTASASSEWSGAGMYAPVYAFDADPITFWASAEFNPPTQDQWLMFDYGANGAKVITGYRFQQYNVIFNITGWKFQGSNDNSTWNDLDVHSSGHVYTASMEDYPIPNRTAYRYYRFYIPAANLSTSRAAAVLTTFEMYSQVYNNLLIAGTGAYPAGVGIGTASPASILDVGGSLGLPIRSVSEAYTVGDSDFAVVATAAVTVTLPAAATCTGRAYAIKRETAAGAVTIVPNGSETIDGAANKSLATNYDAVIVQSDGTAWHTLAQPGGGGSVDLSPYYTKTQTDTLLSAKLDVASAFTQTQADARYLQAEADTLNSVTTRNASTSNAITVGGVTAPVVTIGNATAPSPTTNKLYATSGDLYWNGTKLNTGGGGGSTSIYGGGSAGNVTIDSSTDWSLGPPANNNTWFQNLTINTPLYVPSGTEIHCTGNLTIGSGGMIVVSAFAGGNVNSPNPGVAPGIASTLVSTLGIRSDFQAAQIRRPGPVGGGAGKFGHVLYNSAGDGGGTLLILCAGTITIQPGGLIIANGNNSVNANTPGAGINGGGGGAGGIIILASPAGITNSGTIQARGGNGSPAFDGNLGNGEGGGGGGGGGIVNFICPNAITQGTVDVAGGNGAAGQGTVSATLAGGGAGGACGGNGGMGGLQGSSGANGTSGRVVQTQLDPAVVY